MKKLLLIFVIIGIVFVAGCIGGEKVTDTKTSTDSQTNQKSDTQTPESIIQPSDVPGLTLKDFSFFAVPKSLDVIHDGLNGPTGLIRYKDNLPVGTKKIGAESSSWEDATGRLVSIGYIHYDSTNNFSSQKLLYPLSNLNSWKEQGKIIGYGDPKIGDYSIWIEYPIKSSSGVNNPDVQHIFLNYIYKTNIVNLQVIDEKDKSLNEAVRIAKLIQSRLD